MKLIDGKACAQQVKDEVKDRVLSLNEKGVKVTLAVVLVGDDPASKVYVRNKARACEYCGIESRQILLPADISEKEVLERVAALNADSQVNGILVQLPVPPQVHADKIIQSIVPEKDVDGFSPYSVGALSIGIPGMESCTPAGIIELLHRNGIDTDGKECVIAGRSNIVGKPMGMLMLRENATVTITHSHTRNLPEVTSRADILITAIGKARYFSRDYVKEGAVIIDCGMNRDENGKLCGDVDFEDVKDKVSAITPVPGGVGPMTVAMLMHNVVQAAAMQNGI